MRRMLLALTLACSGLTHAEDAVVPAIPAPAPAAAVALVANAQPPLVAPAPTPPVVSVETALNGQGLVLAMDRILPGATEDKIKSLLPQETRAVLNLYLAGQIRQWYFRQDRPGVVFVLESNTLEHARELLKDLPLARAGLVDYDLVPLGPYIPLATLLQNEAGKKTRRP